MSRRISRTTCRSGRWLAALLLLGWLGQRTKAAAETGTPPTGPALAEDPVVAALVGEALANRPELAQAKATIQAELERVPQASALPDPVVTMGIQNDGFSSIQLGEMETSWLVFMGSQTFPWAGKRDLQGEVIALGARRAETDLQRVQLSIQAEVERAYIDLLLARDQLRLLAKLESLWSQAESMAQVRYESGDGVQSDLLRAQLERSRLKQRRFLLEAEERRRIAVLNRLRGRPAEEAIDTSRSLADLPDPVLPDSTAVLADAEVRSPELQKSQLAIDQAAKQVDLAEKGSLPDLTVSAGVMPRGGDFETMWTAGVSFSIPIWSRSKQSAAVEANTIQGTAARYGAESTRQLLHQRMIERQTLLSALIETNRLYRAGLLVQSEATVASTTAQYQVGRITFASVLEALTGYVADTAAFYESVAATQRVEIAQRELSLEPVAGVASAGMGGAPMPGAGAMSQGSWSDAAATASPAAARSGSMSGM